MTNVLVIFQLAGLNAPFGAQCFPTFTQTCTFPSGSHVSMHLLVLSAFRLSLTNGLRATACLSQCTFWCSVLSDSGVYCANTGIHVSQCTFWCSVLSDLEFVPEWEQAFIRLNAPFGAQCFPTKLMRMHMSW